jgi:hypothetical protein
LRFPLLSVVFNASPFSRASSDKAKDRSAERLLSCAPGGSAVLSKPDKREPAILPGALFDQKELKHLWHYFWAQRTRLGIDKFLQVAWDNDQISGEANFDIDRENIREEEILLPLAEMRPNKIAAFESELEHLLRDGRLTDELQVMRVCFEYGVRRQHATPVLSKLKLGRVIELDFRVPDIRRLDSPRPIRMIAASERRR